MDNELVYFMRFFKFIFKDGPKIPCAFDTYDVNGDDLITKNEFLQATSGLPQTTSVSIFIGLDKDRKLHILISSLPNVR